MEPCPICGATEPTVKCNGGYCEEQSFNDWLNDEHDRLAKIDWDDPSTYESEETIIRSIK